MSAVGRRPRTAVVGLLTLLALRLSASSRDCTAFGSSARRISGKSLVRSATSLASSGQDSLLTCVTDEGRSLEELLRARLSGAADFPGTYKITSQKPAVVGPAKELGKPPFLAELPEGAVVNVVEVVEVPGDQRVRARIDSPVVGWISLLNTKTGFRWAEREGKACLTEFDESIEKVRERLCEDKGIGCDMSEAMSDSFAGEIQDRLRSDVLYLSVVRSYDEEGLPLVPTFEASDKQKTWAMSGDGLEQWQNMAKGLSYQVQLTPLVGAPKSDFKRAILRGRAEYSDVLTAYTNVFINRVLGQPFEDGSYSAFDGFLKRFAEMKREMLASIGGAGGLPTRSRTSSGTGGGREAGEEETMEWLSFFMMLRENTRMAQADDYFSHALFGLCLRRLTQRFELERSMGMLPELPNHVQARISLESSADEVQGQSALASAQFAAFADEVCSRDSDALANVLTLSKSTLGALRRQTEYVFGRGLRDEIARPMDRAQDELEKEDTDASLLEATASLLLESAASGELRMLSTSPAARERLAWDAILYGALLQGAEDATPSP